MSQVGIADPCVCRNRDATKYRLYETKSGQILGKQCIPCKREWLIPEYQTPDVPDGYYISDDTAFDLGQSSQQVPASGNEEVAKSSDSESEGSDSGREESEPLLSLRKPFEVDDNTAGQIIGSRTKIDWNFEQLIPGNHITWQRKLGYYHHAIVVDINDYGLYIIHWTKPTAGQIQIAKEFLTLDKIMADNPDSLYRLDYPPEVEKTNDITLVLARAFSRNGDKKYGLLGDNCESFATFCKTGYEKSHQVVWLESKMKEFLGELGVTIVRTLVKTGSKVLANKAVLKHTAAIVSASIQKAGHEIAETAVQEFAQILADATAKVKGKLSAEAIRSLWQNFAAKTSGSANKVATEIAKQAVDNMAKGAGGKVFVAESAETIGKASNIIGAGLVILLESFFYIKDVYKLYSAYAKGDQSRRVFIEDTTRRSVEGVSAASLTIVFSLGPEAVCALVGTSMGPVGTLVGAVIGGAIGCAVGKAVGTTAGSHLGRKVAKGFQNDQAVKSIHDLNPGDHVVLTCGGLKHPRCHAIIVKHNGTKGHIKVIRNRYKEGVVEEWLEFKKPVFKVMYEKDECKDSQKVILYARLKQYEDYTYSLARYNCKTFARECKTKSVLI